MDNTTRVFVLAAVAALTTGCSINNTVEPLPAVPVSKICILENPKVLMDGFQPEVVSQLQALNFQTHVYTGERPTECSHHLEYTANWAWDLAMYLTYAEFRVYDARGIAGTATYNARNGGMRLDKFGPTAEKIRPLLMELFAAIQAGEAVPVAATPANEDQALAAAIASTEARLKELARLKEQALITDEEYTNKRREILSEI
jgi:hypothetical protein